LDSLKKTVSFVFVHLFFLLASLILRNFFILLLYNMLVVPLPFLNVLCFHYAGVIVIFLIVFK